MYEINKKYKFNITFDDDFKSYYIATVLDEDEHSIKIDTKDGEKLIVNKKNIVKAKMLENGNL